MGKFVKVWSAKQPETYKSILFRCNEERAWRFRQNWKFNFRFPHFNVITPLLRVTKCNGKFEFGLGNHYFEIRY